MSTSFDSPEFGKGLPRWVDAPLALFALIAASPVIVVFSAAVALSSKGPIFFTQKRVGKNGRLFSFYKFRTMTPSAGGPEVTSSTDQRITRLGRFLRQTKLDELPTFWNVVKGDLALVGPRPEVPRYVNLDDSTWRAVLTVRPGLTDPVTLELKNEEELLAGIGTDTEAYYLTELQPLKLNGYLAYLKRRNWRSDVRIITSTLAAVFYLWSRAKTPSSVMVGSSYFYDR